MLLKKPCPGAAEQHVLVNKTATDLDSNEETAVTLNVGGTSSKPISDVVFLPDKSASTDVRKAALHMLKELITRVGENRIKAGMVSGNTLILANGDTVVYTSGAKTFQMENKKY